MQLGDVRNENASLKAALENLKKELESTTGKMAGKELEEVFIAQKLEATLRDLEAVRAQNKSLQEQLARCVEKSHQTCLDEDASRFSHLSFRLLLQRTSSKSGPGPGCLWRILDGNTARTLRALPSCASVACEGWGSLKATSG